MPRTGGAAASLSGTAFRIDERTQVIEAVGGDYAAGYQLPQSSFNFGFQFSGCANDIGKKRRAPLPQVFKHLARDRAESLRLCDGGVRSHPVGFVANKKRDGRDAGGN